MYVFLEDVTVEPWGLYDLRVIPAEGLRSWGAYLISPVLH